MHTSTHIHTTTLVTQSRLYHVAHTCIQEYLAKYNKKFGIDQQKGMHEELAMHFYGERYNEFLSKDLLVKRYIDGVPFVAYREVAAGSETGTDHGHTLSRKRTATQKDGDDLKPMLKALGWFFELPISESSTTGVSQVALEKLDEALLAVEKLTKEATKLHNKRDELTTGNVSQHLWSCTHHFTLVTYTHECP